MFVFFTFCFAFTNCRALTLSIFFFAAALLPAELLLLESESLSESDVLLDLNPEDFTGAVDAFIFALLPILLPLIDPTPPFDDELDTFDRIDCEALRMIEVFDDEG